MDITKYSGGSMSRRGRDRVLNVGGTFEVDLDYAGKRSKSAAAIVELYELTKPFFPGSEDEKFIWLSRMLQNAKLLHGVLYFSFPKKIRKKCGLEVAYKVVVSMGHPTRLYAEKLRFHLKNINTAN